MALWGVTTGDGGETWRERKRSLSCTEWDRTQQRKPRRTTVGIWKEKRGVGPGGAPDTNLLDALICHLLLQQKQHIQKGKRLEGPAGICARLSTPSRFVAYLLICCSTVEKLSTSYILFSGLISAVSSNPIFTLQIPKCLKQSSTYFRSLILQYGLRRARESTCSQDTGKLHSWKDLKEMKKQK